MSSLTRKAKKEDLKQDLIDNDQLVDTNMSLLFRGSISHGLYREDDIDDIDFLAIYLAPKSHYLGFPKSKHQKGRDRFEGPYDVVNYEYRFFTSLLKGVNPNVFQALFVDKEFILGDSRGFLHRLRANKELFIDDLLIYNSYKGYAHGQYDKLKKDRQNMEEIEELSELTDKRKNGDLEIGEEKRFQELSNKYHSGWMGQKRKENVLEYGYDPKWAVHTLRLLRTGRDFLKGLYRVNREGIDKEELMGVKNGEFSLGEVQDKIEDEFEEFENVYDDIDNKRSVDEEQIENLVIRTLSSWL